MTPPGLITWPPMPPQPDVDAASRTADTWPRHKARKRGRRRRRQRNGQ